MRDRMPKVAAWIDALRSAFGREHVDECIRRGLVSAGGAWEFKASENGHVVGGVPSTTTAPGALHGSHHRKTA